VARRSNDTLNLVPQTELHGPVLEFDFPGLEIGCAEYDAGPTGCTVFHFPEGASLQTDVRGGSPGTFGGGYEWVNAICLAGGSLYGLEAVSGVAAELFARREYRTGWLDIPLVAGAIIFDYGPRDNGVYPDKELGRAALRSARPGVFPLGARGAGRSATAGKTFDLDEREPAGQGAAFRRISETRIAVFTVVNSVGAIVDRDGTVLCGHLDAATGLRRSLVPGVEERLAAGAPRAPAAREHDADRCRHRPEARAARPAHTRPPGSCFDGAGDPTVPRARGRRRSLRGLDQRDRGPGSRKHRARHCRLRARVGRRARCRTALSEGRSAGPACPSRTTATRLTDLPAQ